MYQRFFLPWVSGLVNGWIHGKFSRDYVRSSKIWWNCHCLLSWIGIQLQISNLLRWIRQKFSLLFLCSDLPKDQVQVNKSKKDYLINFRCCVHCSAIKIFKGAAKWMFRFYVLSLFEANASSTKNYNPSLDSVNKNTLLEPNAF